MISIPFFYTRSKDFRASLEPVNQLTKIGEKWRSTGDDPYFAIKAKLKPGSWYEFQVKIDLEVDFQIAKFYFDFGEGYLEQDSVVLPLNSGELAKRLVFFEQSPLQIRFDPVTSAGDIDLKHLRLRIKKTESARESVLEKLISQHKKFKSLNIDSAKIEINSRLESAANESDATSWDTIAAEFYNQTFLGRGTQIASYSTWIREVETLHSKKIANLVKGAPKDSPKISVLVPIYKPDHDLLKKMVESVLAQSYQNWELCLVDDASNDSDIQNILESYSESDHRIHYKIRATNGHISQASNDALALASGDFCALLDHDDTLHTHALAHVVNALTTKPFAKIIYSDEDKIDEQGVRMDPHFKSDWNRDLLYSHNYISHLGVYKRSLMMQIGGFRVGYEGSQDYDLLLRCVENCKNHEIVHIPHILYHWRAIEGSTAASASSKSYTEDAGIKALEDHFSNTKVDVTVSLGLLPNTYKVNWQIPNGKYPLVSLLIPTRDGVDLLSACVESILQKTTYPNFEILILDNQSQRAETFAFFREISKNSRVRIIKYDFPFNFSGINNYGATFANGEILGFINNDVEVINPEWLTELATHVCRKEIGCVGAKLYFENDTIQHGGIILGVGGIAGHSHKYYNREHPGYFSRLNLVQNLSAVTAAVQLVRKDVFLQVGGLNEALSVAFNDVDFCLKVDRAGYRNLWTPYAELYHYESISRGEDISGAKKIRFEKENELMRKKWGVKLKNDPYYNPNLTLTQENFTIGLPKVEA